MNRTYLSQIDISNFRSFGPNFSLDVPAKPGLVVIYGMNGLGKTTFFEAIEWLLTADARRISDSLRAGQLDKYLTRRDADDMSHQVAIKFGDEERRFVRTASTGPSPSELADFLTDSDWGSQPTDTTPYFRLTMFLPQSKRFRFEEEKPAEQWKLLEGPAGVERLRQVLQAVGSVKTKNAFERLISDLKNVAEKRQTQLKDWQELLRRRNDLQSQVSSVRVIEPSAAENSLQGVRESLAGLTDIDPLLEALNSEGNGTARKVSEIVQLLDETLEKRRESLQRLKDSSATCSEWETIASDIKNSNATIKRDLEKLNAETSDLDALISEKRRLTDLRKETDSELSTLKKRVALMRSRDLAVNTVKSATAKITELEDERHGIWGRLEKSKLKLNLLSESISKRAELAAELEGVNEKLSLLRQLQAKCDEYQTRASQAELNDKELESLRAEQVSVEEIATKAESRIAELAILEERILESKRLAVASAETVHKALATMCDHIEHDATTCPICQKSYKPGELYALAQKSLAEAGVDTVGLDASLKQVREELSELRLSLVEVTKRRSQLPSLIEQLVNLQADRFESWSEIEKLAIPFAFPGDDIAIAAKDAIEASQQNQSKLSSIIQDLPSSEELVASKSAIQTAITSDENRVSVLASEVIAQRNLIAEHKLIIDSAERDLASLKSADQSWEDFSKQLAEQQMTLGAQLSSLDMEVISANDAVKAKQASQSSVQRTVDQARRDLTVAESRKTVLSERWARNVGMGSPDSKNLGRLVASREEEIELIESNRRRCEQLSAGVDAWNANTQMRDIARRVEAECAKRDNCTEEAVSMSLDASIADAEMKITKAKDALAKAKEMADGLKEKADAFNDRALKPLTNRIQRFHDVLSPFRYQIEWTAKTAAGGGTKLTQSVSRSDGGSHREAPPLAELSDGQISVQGLATLFAASTEYRWSRWPALLLDDPLQSSDLLHASAFIDIIRGLIRDLGYQIFLSSHDMEEAQYIMRKCERSGITVTRCHLLGPGVNGVRWTTE
ncbi:AAA family ATPase [Rhodopirellula bahusiensis]|uniref:Rad50/SbcC-type AAA domain-containing protein n=1 Tax=Rhodopirellula bahusiensis TaxID=2014065 RepID=A0A2G1W2A4_9BACT|nr:AAA family ATPase [Rhodopirellula bahusiensis]PHQ33154.1 hypothetical protein CEE69_22085 [Rhodopirellula bahusiensis]